MMISSGVCGRAGTCHFFFPTMFIRQTGYQVSQCVYGKAGRGVQRWRLAVVLYILYFLPCLSLFLSHLSLVSFPCAAHLYPPALRGGRLLGFDILSFRISFCALFLASFYFSPCPSSIRLQSSSSSSPSTTLSYHHQHYHHHHIYQRRYLGRTLKRMRK